jgi:hypothetical protein
VWEEAVDRGFVARVSASDGVRVKTTDEGLAFLARHGRVPARS